jgi:hypothetical protein
MPPVAGRNHAIGFPPPRRSPAFVAFAFQTIRPGELELSGPIAEGGSDRIRRPCVVRQIGHPCFRHLLHRRRRALRA